MHQLANTASKLKADLNLLASRAMMILLAPRVKSNVETKIVASDKGKLFSVSRGLDKTKRAAARMITKVV